MIPGKKYNPGTFTSRRPTPEKFEHLRKWIAVDEKFLDITNITQLQDINTQLEQSSKLFVSNVISRVIAQIIAKYGDGFVSLEGTIDGRLKVDTGVVAPTVLNADITITGAGRTEIVGLVSGEQIKIVNMMFTVDDEVNITLESHETAKSGAMDFGGTGEPKGMVHHFGNAPFCTVSGEAFNISTVGVGKVNGYVTYYTE